MGLRALLVGFYGRTCFGPYYHGFGAELPVQIVAANSTTQRFRESAVGFCHYRAKCHRIPGRTAYFPTKPPSTNLTVIMVLRRTKLLKTDLRPTRSF